MAVCILALCMCLFSSVTLGKLESAAGLVKIKQDLRYRVPVLTALPVFKLNKSAVASFRLRRQVSQDRRLACRHISWEAEV